MMPHDQNARRVAIIGGASKGLGFSCAQSLAEAGVNIVITGRNQSALEKARDQLSQHHVDILCLSGDMADNEFNNYIIEQTIGRFGRLDILINNSGGPPAGSYRAFSESDWEKSFQAILMYNIRMTTRAIEEMKRNEWGRIINIASLSAKEPAESLVLSNVFRAGVLAFAKSISKEIIQYNITINTLLPGAFRTDRAIALIRQAAEATNRTPEEVEQENTQKLPMKRYLSPEVLGKTAAFLCSEQAHGITGTALQVDGGIGNCVL